MSRDNRLPMFIILKNPWCHKSSASKFLFGTSDHLQLLVRWSAFYNHKNTSFWGDDVSRNWKSISILGNLYRGKNWTTIEMTSLSSRPSHSGNFLGSAHDSCHISSSRNVFEIRWRNLTELKLRLWLFRCIMEIFSRQFTLGKWVTHKKLLPCGQQPFADWWVLL